VQHRLSQGFSLQFGYTYAKSIMLDGMDFNNQFDFSNTHAPSLLDQRQRISFAPASIGLGRTTDRFGRRAQSSLRLDAQQRDGVLVRPSLRRAVESRLHQSCSAVVQHCNGVVVNNVLYGNDNLNDTAFNQDTANTAGASMARAPRRASHQFFLRTVAGEDRTLVSAQFCDPEGKELQFQAQAFNLSTTPTTTCRTATESTSCIQPHRKPTAADGLSTNQQCYLVPNSGPGNFGTYGEISPNGLPRVLQFSARFTF